MIIWIIIFQAILSDFCVRSCLNYISHNSPFMDCFQYSYILLGDLKTYAA